ncbi:MAG TPA: LysM peptidoglycan-binding domain-containing protein [Polyangiaceae bacterium]|nr:LysM peptidoglycan-binding domain-containing protein [Polyangiaceae bacterium]
MARSIAAGAARGVRSSALALALASLLTAPAVASADPAPAPLPPAPQADSHAAPRPSTPKATGASKSGSKSTKATTTRGGVDAAARRAIAGGPTAEDASMGAESPELRALREAERELFPPATPALGSTWPSNLPLVLPGDGGPDVVATGVPPARALPLPPQEERAQDLAWLEHLEMPDLPVRWDERVVRYLQYFRDDPRGHTTFANLYRHSGRWRDMMRRELRRKSLPTDLVWVSMIESGFDPTVHSIAGAAGLWQLMPETAKIYGLTFDRWLDQRLSATLATDAAADLLGDLHRRFGGWELALAGFNMGYAGLASVVKRFNTNDFWSLSRTEGALPWETTLYVPKVFAAAVVAHNLAAFGFGEIGVDPPVESDEVNVPPGTPLTLVAQAVGCTAKDIEALNPDLRASRTPPAADAEANACSVNVPQGKGALAAQALVRLRRDQPPLDRYVVRFGETLDQIAAAHKTTTQKLVELNAIAPGEAVRGGTVLLVPHVEPAAFEGPAATGPKQAVVVPADVFVYPDRKRVFYRVLVGDTLKEIGSALRVSPDELARWNGIDPAARLQDGMTLQAFVAPDADLSRVVVVPENDVRVVAVGSEEFFANLEHDKGVKRITVVARDGDTVESIGRRFDVTARTMERVNHQNRRHVLKAGDTVVVYVPNNVAAPGGVGPTAINEPVPNGPLPAPPVPDLLP